MKSRKIIPRQANTILKSLNLNQFQSTVLNVKDCNLECLCLVIPSEFIIIKQNLNYKKLYEVIYLYYFISYNQASKNQKEIYEPIVYEYIVSAWIGWANKINGNCQLKFSWNLPYNPSPIINPNGARAQYACTFSRMAITSWKMGSQGPKYLDF